MPWKWYYHAGGAPLWLLTVVLVVAFKENRRRQAWLIFLPLALLALLWRMPVRLLAIPEETAEWFGMIVMSCGMAWAAVWLRAHRLARWPKAVAFILAWALMLAIGGIACLSHLGLENWGDWLSIFSGHAICSAGLLLGMAMAGRSCRHGFRRGRFMGRLYLWTALAAALALSALFTVAAVFLVLGAREMLAQMFVMMSIQVVMGSLFFATALFLLNLPFLVLAFNSPFYRERFHALFCPESPLTAELVDDASPRYAPPLSTDPTNKPVSVADVVGPWRFYLDEATSTVVVDFHADGTFAQTIASNRGEVKECPGGTWRLEGPLIQLSGYVTTKEGIAETRTWWMVDTSEGPAVFGGETTFFRMLRGPQPNDVA